MLCERSCGTEKISPRIAISAFKLFDHTKSLESFKYVSGINIQDITQILDDLANKKQRDLFLENIKILQKEFNELDITGNIAPVVSIFIKKISEKIRKIDSTDEVLLKEIRKLFDIFDYLNIKIDDALMLNWERNKKLYPSIMKIYESI